jgi:hypothetical protein
MWHPNRGTGKPLGPVTVNTYIGAMNAFCAWLRPRLWQQQRAANGGKARHNATIENRPVF